MTGDSSAHQSPSYICHVFKAGCIRVTTGANTGDPLAHPAEISLGDVYELDENPPPFRLTIGDDTSPAAQTLGQFTGGAVVADGAEIGTPGTPVTIEAKLTFMAPDGTSAELLTLGLDGGAERVFLPLSPIEPGLDYILIDASDTPDPVELSDITSVAFARGTKITLADGSQRAIEHLRPGDLVLTRTNGPQPVRQILARTVRAVGSFAPVMIPKGILGNADDLVLSQHQRLFVYQRGPHRIVDRAEMLIRAHDLVDGQTITLRRGGYCDYVSLVFDRHEVIYAECIPAESLLVNEVTRRQLPEDARTALDKSLPQLSQAPVLATEAPSTALAAARERLVKSAR